MLLGLENACRISEVEGYVSASCSAFCAFLMSTKFLNRKKSSYQSC